jgi:hypothetical protein
VLAPHELERLERTLLPALERHHLRLLAHALRTLQTIAGGASDRPSAEAISTWASQQPAINGDTAFMTAFTNQMLAAAIQLEAIAAPLSRPALALDLDDLVVWAEQQAQRRLSPPPN